MALFKPYSGTETELSQVTIHDGYCYLLTENGKLGTVNSDVKSGRLFADVGTQRYEIISDFSSHLVKFDAAGNIIINYTAEEIQNKFKAVTTNAYTATLAAASWTASGDSYQYVYSNTNLKCGPNGNVPPIISYTSNQDEYSNITSATATPGTGITFISSKKPTAAIGIVIIDH